MIDVEDVPRGNGNPLAMAGSPSTSDAPVVERLRSAGADVFATASLLEYAAGAPHPELPEARNPVDPSRTAGGSSGGSAALVAAGVCPAALGTDTGGSIRIPAAYCGVVGFKPTHGAVPVDGVQTLSPSLDHVGVIAVDVATAAAVFAVISGSPVVPEPPTVRIAVLVDELADPRLQPDVHNALLEAVSLLRASGIELVERDAAPLRALHDTFGPIVLHEAWKALSPLLHSDPEHFSPDTERLLRAGEQVDDAAYAAALAERARLLPAADGLLDGVDALLGPVVAFTAPVDTPVLDSPDGEVEGLFTESANLTGQPAISLPCGHDADGLPVGLQLAGRRGDDAGLLSVAAAVERALARGTR